MVTVTSASLLRPPRMGSGLAFLGTRSPRKAHTVLGLRSTGVLCTLVVDFHPFWLRGELEFRGVRTPLIGSLSGVALNVLETCAPFTNKTFHFAASGAPAWGSACLGLRPCSRVVLG